MKKKLLAKKMMSLSMLLCLGISNTVNSQEAVTPPAHKRLILHEGNVVLEKPLKKSGKTIKSVYVEISYLKKCEQKPLVVYSSPDPVNPDKGYGAEFKQTVSRTILPSKKEYPSCDAKILELVKIKLKNELMPANDFNIHQVGTNFKNEDKLERNSQKVGLDFKVAGDKQILHYIFQHYWDYTISIYESRNKENKLSEYILPRVYCASTQGLTHESLIVKEVTAEHLCFTHDQILAEKKKALQK